MKFPFKRIFQTAAVCVACLGDALTTATVWPFFLKRYMNQKCFENCEIEHKLTFMNINGFNAHKDDIVMLVVPDGCW